MFEFISTFSIETKVAGGAIILLITYFHVKYTRHHLEVGPTILTTAGIFGCFLGIAMGLLKFDPAKVADSVPMLIDGIKTAFWVSLLGILGALSLKMRPLFLDAPDFNEEQESQGATIDDLAKLLAQLNRSLAGNEDSALISQTKLMRQDTNDRLDKLRNSLDSFAEKVAEANSEALIKALEEVIRDFNAKINEQFGENFKQLNAAVEKLVVWQEQYKDQLNQLIETETTTRKSMTEASLRYAELVAKADIFNSAVEKLDTLLSGLEVQRGSIEKQLTVLATLVNTAATGLPELEKKIEQLVRQLTDGTQSAGERVEKMTDDVNKQVVALNVGMEKALTESLTTLGRQLAALSNKFVEDYTPLTERLRELVQNSKGI